MAIIPPKDDAAFIKALGREFGSNTPANVFNNNHTYEERAIQIELKDVSDSVSALYKKVNEHNRQKNSEPVTVIARAGYEVKGGSTSFSPWNCFTAEDRSERMEAEYAQSYSLNNQIMVGASIYLRTGKKAQSQSLSSDGKLYTVTSGVRITDGDKWLHEQGKAFPSDISTLHVSSFVGGSSTSSYGPKRKGGAMTANIVSMDVVNYKGDQLTLSETKNKGWFDVFRHGHFNTAFFVSRLVFNNIENSYLMVRKSFLFKNAEEFHAAMKKDNLLTRDHFIMMSIPVQDGSPQIKAYVMERAQPGQKRTTGCQACIDFGAYILLEKTDLGEPLIDVISKSEELECFMPLVLKLAADQGVGTKESVEIDWSFAILHIFSTYTGLPLVDINWLIVCESDEEAMNLLCELKMIVDSRVNEYAKQGKHPILNKFARYIGGIFDPDCQTISPLAKDKETQTILSFELLSFTPIAKRRQFKELTQIVVDYLKEKRAYTRYHLGKNLPDSIKTIHDIYLSENDQKRVKSFQKGILALHDEDITKSPHLTPERKVFWGLEKEGKGKGIAPSQPLESTPEPSPKEKAAALRKIKQLGARFKDQSALDLASKKLAQIS